MSNRNLPIYQLTPSCIAAIIDATSADGKQFYGPAFSYGDHPVEKDIEGGYLPAGKFQISQSRGVVKYTKCINIFELTSDHWLYSSPLYRIKKINGTTSKSVNDSSIVVPSNARAAYQVEVSWEDTPALESISLKIIKHKG